MNLSNLKYPYIFETGDMYIDQGTKSVLYHERYLLKGSRHMHSPFPTHQLGSLNTMINMMVLVLCYDVLRDSIDPI